jgi:predicted enzyme related to lactoylglutathione lyase
MIQAVWIEIPVKNLERAMQFYQAVFGLEPGEVSADDVRRTVTLDDGMARGNPIISLNQTRNFEPRNQGTLIYLGCGEDMTERLERTEPAGGRIVAGKTSLGSAGCFASFLDTEGNVLALYSVK